MSLRASPVSESFRLSAHHEQLTDKRESGQIRATAWSLAVDIWVRYPWWLFKRSQNTDSANVLTLKLFQARAVPFVAQFWVAGKIIYLQKSPLYTPISPCSSPGKQQACFFSNWGLIRLGRSESLCRKKKTRNVYPKDMKVRM